MGNSSEESKLEKERYFLYLMLALALGISSGVSVFFYSEMSKYEEEISKYHIDRMFFFMDKDVPMKDGFPLITCEEEFPEDEKNLNKCNFYHHIIQAKIDGATLFGTLFILSLFPLLLIFFEFLSLTQAKLDDLKDLSKRLNSLRNKLFLFPALLVITVIFSFIINAQKDVQREGFLEQFYFDAFLTLLGLVALIILALYINWKPIHPFQTESLKKKQ
ncbi:MAG: hypothetical protein ABH986_04690 [archaeon]